MGNHEYCVDCGVSDFHFGRPCNPKLVAKEQERQRVIDAIVVTHEQRALEVVSELKRLGYPAEIGNYGDIVISKWDLKVPGSRPNVP